MPSRKREPVQHLPDLFLNAAEVPGGVGAEIVFIEPVTVADIEWTREDADSSGSPIGYMLAVETSCSPDDTPVVGTSNS